MESSEALATYEQGGDRMNDMAKKLLENEFIKTGFCMLLSADSDVEREIAFGWLAKGVLQIIAPDKAEKLSPERFKFLGGE